MNENTIIFLRLKIQNDDYLAVVGPIIVDTSHIEFAGNPPFEACSFKSSLFRAL